MIHFQPSGAHDWTVCVCVCVPSNCACETTCLHVVIHRFKCTCVLVQLWMWTNRSRGSKYVQAVDHRHSNAGAVCLMVWQTHGLQLPFVCSVRYRDCLWRYKYKLWEVRAANINAHACRNTDCVDVQTPCSVGVRLHRRKLSILRSWIGREDINKDALMFQHVAHLLESWEGKYPV